MAQEAGNKPSLNMPALVRHILSTGGWTDLDEVILPGSELPDEVE